MRAAHVNITLPLDLKTRVDEESRRERIGRSPLIQKALKLYLDLIRRRQLKNLLIEGYSEMKGESLRLAKDFEELDIEALKYVD